MQVKLFFSLLIWSVDCTQFLSENCPNGCQIFGRFGSSKTDSEPIFAFPHIPWITGMKATWHYIRQMWLNTGCDGKTDRHSGIAEHDKTQHVVNSQFLWWLRPSCRRGSLAGCDSRSRAPQNAAVVPAVLSTCSRPSSDPRQTVVCSPAQHTDNI